MAEDSKKTSDALATIKTFGSTINELRKKNPTGFYIGVAVIAVALWLLFAGGGGGTSPSIKTTLVTGEIYTLQNPNIGDTLLVATPGKFASADYKEEDSQNICVIKPGTQATLLEEAFVNYIPYVKVKPIEGSCEGKTGWTSKVNIKPR